MILKRVQINKYDELFEMIDVSNFFKKDKNEILNILEANSEVIKINDKPIEINLNIEEYEQLMELYPKKGDSSVAIAQKLYQDFRLGDVPLPKWLMYEKEMWTYLNLTIFFDLVQKKYIDFNEKKEQIKGKIERVYFNDGGLSKIDRTGLRWLWVIADLTTYEGNFELTKIAWDFIDPFKAIQECVLGNNDLILKALVIAIKKLNYDSRIRNSINKTRVPKHIRNYACSIMLDSYNDLDVLAEELAQQISIILV